MLEQNVSFIVAFTAGFVSFFSPCILPMIPAYIMYMTGSSIDELEDNRMFAVKRTLGFILGFTIIFMIMGTSASFIGQIFAKNKQLFSKISGGILIIFGLNMMGILKLDFLNKEKRRKGPSKKTGMIGSILMGMAFAAGWTPCFGPVLGAILMYAGASDTLYKGVLLLLVYSLGMGLPFLLTALFINGFNRFINKYEKVINILPKISGVILVVFGLLVFFNKVVDISRLLL